MTYDRPVEATLIVRLANGDEWKAREEDLAKFDLVRRLDAYAAFDDHLSKILHEAGLIQRELTEAQLNPLRYLVELAICHPDLLTHRDVAAVNAEVVEIERTLERLAAERGGSEG
ncbi:hypothetical protein [Phytohabitans houttuyneae]|uniref:hypothetical protein n=1 Tax=Phytohabitans houttuyneae TaxID=1076126 RepID=UPI001563EB9B|nr:hypothetical protein [Phytohabitans houttuyneae]